MREKVFFILSGAQVCTSKLFWSEVLLEKAYKLSSTVIPSTKECYKDRLNVVKHMDLCVKVCYEDTFTIARHIVAFSNNQTMAIA